MSGAEFRTAPLVVFGSGARRRIGELARPFGERAFLVTGGRSLADSGELAKLEADLRHRGMTWASYAVRGEPDVDVVDEGARRCASAACELVVAVGGGSALDVAKAVAAVVTNGGSALDYLQDLPSGGGKALARPPLPFVAVPTTAGSGSEVTKNAVLRVPEAALKRSLRSDLMLPRVAIVDPDLSRSAPRGVLVPSALDALTHLLEGYVSRGAHPMTDVLARPGFTRSFRALSSIADGGAAAPVADDLALASLWGGMVLANAGLGAVHGLVAPLGGRFPVPHGCGCGALLAATVRVNVAALEAREPGHPALARYGEIARIALGPSAGPRDLAGALERLRTKLGARPLAHYGVAEDALASVVQGARGGSMKTNPIVLTDAELEAILREALGSVDVPGP